MICVSGMLVSLILSVYNLVHGQKIVVDDIKVKEEVVDVGNK